MEHKQWSMQWVRWAHSAVDYLAAAVGGDRVGGGAVGEGMDGGIPIELGQVLEAMVCVCLDLLVTGSGWSLGREGERDQVLHFEHYWKTIVLLSSCHKETSG